MDGNISPDIIARVDPAIAAFIHTPEIGSQRFGSNITTTTEPSGKLLSSLLALTTISSVLFGNTVPTQADARPTSTTPTASTYFLPDLPLSENMIQENYFQAKAFTNMSESDRIKAEDEIHQEFDKYRIDLPRILSTLRWESKISQTVANPQLKIPIHERSYWRQLLMGIVFVESGGNPTASSGIAFGLAQLKPDTAQEMADLYGIKNFQKEQLNNPDTNLFLSIAYLRKLDQIYGPNLSIWAYHLGQGNLNRAIWVYLSSEKKVPIKDLETAFSSTTYEELNTLINQYQLNSTNLLKSSAVTAELKFHGAFENDTERYFYRVIAANEIQSAFKQNLDKLAGAK